MEVRTEKKLVERAGCKEYVKLLFDKFGIDEV